MNTIKRLLIRFWNWLDDVPPDDVMEAEFSSFNVANPHPKWHYKFYAVIRNLTIALTALIPVVLYLKFGSTEGSWAVFQLTLMFIAPLALLALVVATLQRKYNFARSLGGKHREHYLKIVGLRFRRMIIMLSMGLLFLAAILLVDKLSNGEGWF